MQVASVSGSSRSTDVPLDPVAGTVSGEGSLLNRSEVFSSDAYPAEALKKREQGTAAARVSYDQDGRPTACHIVQSSGSPSLDATTCRLLIAKGKFNLGRANDGQPVVSEGRVKVRWTLPEGDKSISWVDYVVRTIFSFAPGGTPEGCRVELTLPIDHSTDRCLNLRPTLQIFLKRVAPGFDSGGKELVFESGSLVGEGADSLPVGRADGLTLMHRQVIAVARDEGDKMIECRSGRSDSISNAVLKRACAQFAVSKSDASVSKSAKRVRPRNWVHYEAVYWRPTTAAKLYSSVP